MYASASRRFEETRELLSRVKVDRGYFLGVSIGAFPGLAQPSTDRELAKSRGKAKKGQEKGTTPPYKVASLQTLVHLESCQKHRPHAQNLVHQCPRSVRRKQAQLVVRHITLLGFVLISACCVAKLSIVHQNVSTKGNQFHGERAFGTYARGCAVFDAMCYGADSFATVEGAEEDQELKDIEDFVAFSIKSLEGFAILDGRATKTVSGFTSVQPVVDQHEKFYD